MLTVRASLVATEAIERVFGMAIAYVLPGAIALFGISYFQPELRRWFGFVAEHDTTLAGFLFVVAASAGLGVLLSALRAFLLEKMWKAAKPRVIDHSARVKQEAVYQNLISQHYNYYQCYGNTAVASWFFTIGYLRGVTGFWHWFMIIGVMALTDTLLVWAALDAIKRFENKRETLLKSA